MILDDGNVSCKTDAIMCVSGRAAKRRRRAARRKEARERRAARPST